MDLYLLVLVLVINLLAVPAGLAILHLLLKEISWMDLLLLLCSVSTYIWAGMAVFLVLTPPPPIEDPPSKERGVWAIYMTSTVVILMVCSAGVAVDWSYRLAGDCGSQTRPGCRVWDWGCPPVILDTTSDKQFKSEINRIYESGPTLMAGRVVNTKCTTDEHGKIFNYFWDFKEVFQFPYETWSNQIPDSKPSQEDFFDLVCGDGGFPDLEKLLNTGHPLVVKVSIKIVPENQKTSAKYQEWDISYRGECPVTRSIEDGKVELTIKFSSRAVLDTSKEHKPNNWTFAHRCKFDEQTTREEVDEMTPHGIPDAQLPHFEEQSW